MMYLQTGLANQKVHDTRHLDSKQFGQGFTIMGSKSKSSWKKYNTSPAAVYQFFFLQSFTEERYTSDTEWEGRTDATGQT